ncbi:MAG: cytochrome P450 [Thermoleophilaceae bacterium]|nr:cytochrome P450 [Thermoleophilaceae bacterium]
MTGRLPPGPRTPAVLQTARFMARPIGTLDRLYERYGPVFTLTLWPLEPMVVLADPDAVREVWSRDRLNLLPKVRNVVLEPLLGPRSLLLQEGEEHLRRRKLLLPPFHGERMRAYRATMREAAERDMERWPVGRPFPLLERTQAITLEVILRAVFGTTPGPREEELRVLLRDILNWSAGLRANVMLALAQRRELLLRTPLGRLVARADRLLHAEIAERRAASDLEDRSDILSLLVMARDEDGEPLSEAELRDQLMTLLAAGHETTATGLAWAFDALFRNPRVLERLREELASGDEEYLGAVVQEALRVRPVVPEVGRLVGEPVEVCGHRLEAGTPVLASVQLIHRRADIYPDPLAFRPERFLEDKPGTYTWIPFGGGTRRCIGAAFAELEMREVIRAIVERADLRPATDRPEPPARRAVTLAPANGTPVIVAAPVRSRAAAAGAA